MYANLIGLVFIGLGCLLLLVHGCRMWCLKRSWNESFIIIYWVMTLFFTGVSILLTAILTEVICANGCERVWRDTQIYSVFLGCIMIGVSYWFCQCYKEKWDDNFKNYPYSTIDITTIFIGFGVFLTDFALGECPSTCLNMTHSHELVDG